MSSIDVIVPCYKYGHFLTECVQSVLVQSGVDVRVLIIDDASPDNTIDVATRLAAADPRVRVIRHSVNKGHITTYNEGLEWASAEYVLLLSADDYLLPDALSSSVELMDKHPDVGFTYGKAIIITPAGNDLETVYREQKRGWQISDGRTFIRRSGAFNIVPTPTAVVRTALQKRVGGYRHELPHSGDMEMWLRLAAYGSVGVIDSYQAAYRLHDSNMSLAYYDDGAVPDLRHKKAAIDCFLETCNSLPGVAELRSGLLRSLGAMAVGKASAAFNDNNHVLSERLTCFALEVHPGIARSLPWAKLSCKRKLPWLWRALQSVKSATRRRPSQDGPLRGAALEGPPAVTRDP